MLILSEPLDCWVWNQLSIVSTCPPRHLHSSTLYGDSLYVYGGCTDDGVTTDDFRRFDFSMKRRFSNINITATKQWYPLPKYIKCHSHTLVYRPKSSSNEDSFILFGGIDKDEKFNHVHEYNIGWSTWRNLQLSWKLDLSNSPQGRLLRPITIVNNIKVGTFSSDSQ